MSLDDRYTSWSAVQESKYGFFNVQYDFDEPNHVYNISLNQYDSERPYVMDFRPSISLKKDTDGNIEFEYVKRFYSGNNFFAQNIFSAQFKLDGTFSGQYKSFDGKDGKSEDLNSKIKFFDAFSNRSGISIEDIFKILDNPKIRFTYKDPVLSVLNLVLDQD